MLTGLLHADFAGLVALGGGFGRRSKMNGARFAGKVAATLFVKGLALYVAAVGTRDFSGSLHLLRGRGGGRGYRGDRGGGFAFRTQRDRGGA